MGFPSLIVDPTGIRHSRRGIFIKSRVSSESHDIRQEETDDENLFNRGSWRLEAWCSRHRSWCSSDEFSRRPPSPLSLKNRVINFRWFFVIKATRISIQFTIRVVPQKFTHQSQIYFSFPSPFFNGWRSVACMKGKQDESDHLADRYWNSSRCFYTDRSMCPRSKLSSLHSGFRLWTANVAVFFKRFDASINVLDSTIFHIKLTSSSIVVK